MAFPNQQHIALISVYDDPALENPTEEGGGQNIYVRQLGEVLAQKGWQVDMFTRKVDPNQANIVEHRPNCRTIRLKAGPEKYISRDWIFGYLPAFTNAILDFQKQTGIYYPIVHTNYWLSGWVGLKLKKIQTLKLIHTYHSLANDKCKPIERFACVKNIRLHAEKACLQTADYIVATTPQEQKDIYSLASSYKNIKILPSSVDMKRLACISNPGALDITVVSQETGLSAQGQNEFVIANTIDNILDNPEWQKNLAEIPRKQVEEYFSWEQVASQLNELYIKLLQQPSLPLISSNSGLLKNWLGRLVTTQASSKSKVKVS